VTPDCRELVGGANPADEDGRELLVKAAVVSRSTNSVPVRIRNNFIAVKACEFG